MKPQCFGWTQNISKQNAAPLHANYFLHFFLPNS